MQEVETLVEELGLNTVCREASCPNYSECFGRGTATFMILGANCTRNCSFCGVTHMKPAPADPGEPTRVAEAVRRLGLSYVVITSVTRDDLDDGGAALFAETVREIRRLSPKTKVETLIPDFDGNMDALDRVIEAAPDVISHNMETVRDLYDRVRPQADYDRSLEVLRRVAAAGGGTGETDRPDEQRCKGSVVAGGGTGETEGPDEKRCKGGVIYEGAGPDAPTCGMPDTSAGPKCKSGIVVGGGTDGIEGPDEQRCKGVVVIGRGTDEQKRQGPKCKSGVMVGLGETDEQMLELMDDLREAGCSLLTIGQYLRPSPENIPVEAYIEPEAFDRLADIARAKGFEFVASAPFVRSSYHAEEAMAGPPALSVGGPDNSEEATARVPLSTSPPALSVGSSDNTEEATAGVPLSTSPSAQTRTGKCSS